MRQPGRMLAIVLSLTLLATIMAALPAVAASDPEAYPDRSHGIPLTLDEAADLDRRQEDPITARGAVPDRVRGKWRPLPKAPFGLPNGSGIWGDDEMLVFGGETNKIAGYDPRTRRWTRYPRAPLPVFDMLTWTGREVFVRGLVIGPDETTSPVLAFEPQSATWRVPTTAPFEPVGQMAWTGDEIVALSGFHAATYDPLSDTWDPLPDIPDATAVIGLDWTGDRVLAATRSRSRNDHLGLASLDLETREWTLAAPSPLEYRRYLPHGQVWAGTELVLFTERRNDEEWSFTGAYSPETDTWRTIDAECRVPPEDAVWTGKLIVTRTRWALEPVSGKCVRLPDRRDRTRNEQVRVWTGREVIEWSGARGDDMTPLPDGIYLRLPPAARGQAPGTTPRPT